MKPSAEIHTAQDARWLTLTDTRPMYVFFKEYQASKRFNTSHQRNKISLGSTAHNLCRHHPVTEGQKSTAFYFKTVTSQEKVGNHHCPWCCVSVFVSRLSDTLDSVDISASSDTQSVTSKDTCKE